MPNEHNNISLASLSALAIGEAAASPSHSARTGKPSRYARSSGLLHPVVGVDLARNLPVMPGVGSQTTERTATMNILVNVLIDKIGFELGSQRDVQELRDLCYDEAHEIAANMNIYYSHALDNLNRFSEFEPEASEVRQYLGEEDLGNWRSVMTQAAILATVGALETQAEADVMLIEKALHEASLMGFEPGKMYASCVHGWEAHEREDEWRYGTLYTWLGLDGGRNAYLLRLELSEDSQAWLVLSKID